jgi:hypothetical protein
LTSVVELLAFLAIFGFPSHFELPMRFMSCSSNRTVELFTN